MSAAETLRLWSVTTLLDAGLQAGPGLVYWNCKQTALAALERRDTIESMLRDDGVDATAKYLVGKRWEVARGHKDRGSEIHKFAEAYALGREPEPDKKLPPEYVPYAEQLIRWWAKWQPTFLQAEAPVYNITRAYAGTLDGIVTLPAFPGKTWLVDYKTTEKGPDENRPPYDSTPLQLAAYAHAERVGVLADRQYVDRKRYYRYDPATPTEPMPKVDHGLCIVVSPVDCVAIPVAVGEIPFAMFQHVQQVAEWREQGWKLAVGANRYDNDDAPALAFPVTPRASRLAPFGPNDVAPGEPPRPPQTPPFRVIEGGTR